MQSSEELKPFVESMAVEFGYMGDRQFSFRFPQISATRTPTYKPDCVWFDGEPLERNVFAIFEIDRDPSRKHRVGGAALANIVALKCERRLRYFAIAPPEHKEVATTSIEILSKHLGDKWCLDATVIPSFEPRVIRERVRNSLINPSPKSE